MTTSAFAELQSDGIHRPFRPREQMLRQGDDGTHVLLLTSGVARVVLGRADGTELWLAHRGPGSLLGEMAVVHGALRNAHVFAVGPCTTVLVRSDTFLRRIERRELACALYRHTLARQHEQDVAHSEQWSLPVKTRLARFLLRLVDFSTPCGQITGWTQEELARAIGASHIAVKAVLKAWKASGTVEVRRRVIGVNDLRALRILAGEPVT
ncbi:Crp/Fnr family transcriptional regulator [Streptomyces goshikiensis]|uniref:Crp/Fnr family transcriptional regulator n=1 Tax=Streptomyces goshikiensis TaxID=1942 RepID=UPI0036B70CD1